MGISVPLAICFLLDLSTVTEFFTVAGTTFLSWGVADLFSTILEKPRLKDRSPGAAIREDWKRRTTE